MLQENLVLLGVLIIGILFDNRLVAGGAAILLVIKITNFQLLLGALDRRALDLGLIMLIVAVLLPFARGKVSSEDVYRQMLTPPGILAFIAGALATNIQGSGLKLMQARPEIMIGLLLGTLVGVIFFKGIPVGPLAAAGFTAIFLSIWNWLT